VADHLFTGVADHLFVRQAKTPFITVFGVVLVCHLDRSAATRTPWVDPPQVTGTLREMKCRQH
jgi:hypothetical protein